MRFFYFNDTHALTSQSGANLMKSKTLLFAFVVSASAFSFNAFSQEEQFCNNPLKTICVDTKDQRKERDSYITKLKEEIANEAEKNAAPKISEMEQQNRGPLRIFKRMFRRYKIKNQEIMKSAKSRINGIETVVTDPKYNSLLKNYMNQAIDQTNFTEATRTKFKKEIDSIIIGNFGDFLEKTNVENSFIGQLFNPCGSDGMVANAFATKIKDEKYVLICPGFLITLSQSPSEQEKLNTILLAITHEMGHHIDNNAVGDEVYMPYLACLSSNNSSQFSKTKKDEKYCNKKSVSSAECNMKVVKSHSGELIADQWGIKVLAIHAKTEGFSGAQNVELLTNSWASLCGTTDEGIHPTGDFRIETLLRTNPEISSSLSCNNSAIKKPSCTLDGAVYL